MFVAAFFTLFVGFGIGAPVYAKSAIEQVLEIREAKKYIEKHAGHLGVQATGVRSVMDFDAFLKRINRNNTLKDLIMKAKRDNVQVFMESGSVSAPCNINEDEEAIYIRNTVPDQAIIDFFLNGTHCPK